MPSFIIVGYACHILGMVPVVGPSPSVSSPETAYPDRVNKSQLLEGQSENIFGVSFAA